MSPLFSDLLRLKNVPGARVCQEITLDTMVGAAGVDFKGSYGPDGLTFGSFVFRFALTGMCAATVYTASLGSVL